MDIVLDLPINRYVAKTRSSFYYPMLMLPKQQRDAILTVYAFCRYTDDIVDLAEERYQAYNPFEFLDHWRNALKEAIHQESKYSMLNQLVAVAKTFSIPFELFFELIRGVEMDITKKRYQSFDELYEYCYKVASTVGLMSMHIIAKKNKNMEHYAENLGIAMQLTNIIRDVSKDFKMNRLYLPAEDLSRWQCHEEQIAQHITTPEFMELMRFQCARAKSYYQKADEWYYPTRSYIFLPARAVQDIYYQLLLKIEDHLDELLDTHFSISLPRKFGIIFNTWLTERTYGR
jgi:15-cis-phytoene synthase